MPVQQITTARGIGAATRGANLRHVLRGMAGALVLATALVTVAPAQADELDDQRDSLESQIADSNSALTTYESTLGAATEAVAASRASLADAQAALALAQSELDAAVVADQARAAELEVANQNLAAAQQRVQDGQVAIDELRSKAAEDMRISHQQNTALVTLGMVVGDNNTGDISSRLQWAQTLYSANSTALNELTQLQFQLQTDQATMATLEDGARVAKDAAAAQVVSRQSAQAAADAAAAEVARLHSENQAAEAAAAQAVEDERANNQAMQAEMAAVTQRINDRNAAAAAAEAQTAQSQETQSHVAPNSGDSGSGFPLAMPAEGPFTSPYGWRTNPVLGYSELHDGLDIGAGCGTGLYAAASGTVSEVGFVGGWGWRAVIDHGDIGGNWVSTGYNHAEGYIVSPGQWVERGQLIGYVGTTGLSTGCHLHFHVWVNGGLDDPINYL